MGDRAGARTALDVFHRLYEQNRRQYTELFGDEAIAEYTGDAAEVEALLDR